MFRYTIEFAIELAIYFTTATLLSILTTLIMPRIITRKFPRNLAITTLISALAALTITEFWAQLASVPRYDPTTIAICVVSAIAITAIQSRTQEDLE